MAHLSAQAGRLANRPRPKKGLILKDAEKPLPAAVLERAFKSPDSHTLSRSHECFARLGFGHGGNRDKRILKEEKLGLVGRVVSNLIEDLLQVFDGRLDRFCLHPNWFTQIKLFVKAKANPRCHN